MKERLTAIYHTIGLPRLIIAGFLLLLLIIASGTELSVAGLLSDALVRIGQNGIYVLAMVPSIQAGVGLNFRSARRRYLRHRRRPGGNGV